MIVSYRIVYRIVSLPWSGLSLSDTARCHVIITIVLLVNIFCRPRGCVLVPTYRIYGGVSHIFMENVAPLDLEGTRGGGRQDAPATLPPPTLGCAAALPLRTLFPRAGALGLVSADCGEPEARALTRALTLTRAPLPAICMLEGIEVGEG